MDARSSQAQSEFCFEDDAEPGRVCLKCGVVREEFASKNVCKECRAECHRKWREENREKRVEYCRKWREENREKALEYDRKYREENREKTRELRRKYYEENREKELECSRKYREENREKALESKRKYREENREKELEYRRKYYEERLCARNRAGEGESEAVYWLTLAGRVVYIGRSKRLSRRIREHANGPRGTPRKMFDGVLYILEHESGFNAAELEKSLVCRLSPPYNDQFTGRLFPYVEPLDIKSPPRFVSLKDVVDGEPEPFDDEHIKWLEGRLSNE